MGGWDPGMGEESLHSIPVHLFPKHVLDLHMNQEVGFAKEYEEIRCLLPPFKEKTSLNENLIFA